MPGTESESESQVARPRSFFLLSQKRTATPRTSVHGNCTSCTCDERRETAQWLLVLVTVACDQGPGLPGHERLVICSRCMVHLGTPCQVHHRLDATKHRACTNFRCVNWMLCRKEQTCGYHARHVQRTIRHIGCTSCARRRSRGTTEARNLAEFNTRFSQYKILHKSISRRRTGQSCASSLPFR